MKNFEENLARLEKLTADIRQPDISLEDALKNFEEGIKLARGMEKEIDKIEGKIQILMNQPVPDMDTTPELDLFSGADESTGTAGAPDQGTRQ
jgi:exodeoxyribonuclease VII small subunit